MDRDEHSKPDVIDMMNNDQLKQLIVNFINGKELPKEISEIKNPIAKAINRVQGTDILFITIYNSLRNKKDPDTTIEQNRKENYPGENKRILQASEFWFEKTAAVEKIHDQKFLKELVQDIPFATDYGFQSPEAIAISNITDQELLRNIAIQFQDPWFKVAAVNSLDNKNIDVIQHLSKTVTSPFVRREASERSTLLQNPTPAQSTK